MRSIIVDTVKYSRGSTSVPAKMSKLAAEETGAEQDVSEDSMKMSLAQTRDKDVRYWSGQLAQTNLSPEHWRTFFMSMCATLNVSESDVAESINSAYQQVAGGLNQCDLKAEGNKTTESMLSVSIIHV